MWPMHKFFIFVARGARDARDVRFMSASAHVDAQVIQRALKRDVRTQSLYVRPDNVGLSQHVVS